MPRRGVTKFIFLCCLALLLAGCGNLKKETGTIRGQVLNAQNTGISGATVTVERLGITATTDKSGWYQLNRVPEGTHTVIASIASDSNALTATRAAASAVSTATVSTANLSAYRVHLAEDGALTVSRNGVNVPYSEFKQAATTSASVPSSHGSVQVTVQRGVTATADPIALLPSDTTLNNVAVYQADPAPTTAALTIGVEQPLSFDVAYRLLTGKGTLVVAFSTLGSNSPFASWRLAIESGSGERVIGGMLKPPETLAVAADVLLLNEQNNVVAVSMIEQYGTSGGAQLRAPYLFTDSVDFVGVKLSWRGGNTAGFQRYEIRRNYNDTPIAIITDPNATTYTDRFPVEGKDNHYIVMLYSSTTYSSSNDVKVNVNSIGRTVVEIDPKPIYATADPIRDFAYVVFEGRNYLSKIDLQGNEVAKLGVCARPAKLAMDANGSVLAVLCSSSNSMALVDPATFKVTKVVYDLGNIAGMAIDPEGKRVYLGSNQGLLYVDIANGNVIKPAGLNYTSVGEVALDASGETLFMLYNSRVILLRTSDFLFKRAIESNGYWIVPDSKGGRLYLGDKVFDINTGGLLGSKTGFIARGISYDGEMLFGLESENMVFMKRKDDSWVKVDLSPVIQGNNSVSVNADASYAVVTYANTGYNGSYSLYLLDLLTRSQARQGVL